MSTEVQFTEIDREKLNEIHAAVGELKELIEEVKPLLESAGPMLESMFGGNSGKPASPMSMIMGSLMGGR